MKIWTTDRSGKLLKRSTRFTFMRLLEKRTDVENEILLHRSDLKVSAKNRQHFFAIENEFLMFFMFRVKFCIFLRLFYDILSGFRDKFQKRVTCVAFSIKFAITN